jgi:hypothetical protein
MNVSATASNRLSNAPNVSLGNNIANAINITSIESPTKKTTPKAHIQLLNNNHIFSSLGFNVIGGYLTDIPATIVDVDFNNASNSKLPKVRKVFSSFFFSLLF